MCFDFALRGLVMLLAFSQPSGSWLDVPYVEQVKAGCGSAAVAMVVQYWAREYPALRDAAGDTDQIDKLLPATSSGIQGKKLQAYLEASGFRAFIFDGELSDLKHHIDKGRPVIVCLAPNGAHGPLHYAVVVGVSDNRVWLNDSARGRLFEQDLGHFEREWQATGRWALLAVPRQTGS